jgi:hypothetical protein
MFQVLILLQEDTLHEEDVEDVHPTTTEAIIVPHLLDKPILATPTTTEAEDVQEEHLPSINPRVLFASFAIALGTLLQHVIKDMITCLNRITNLRCKLI